MPNTLTSPNMTIVVPVDQQEPATTPGNPGWGATLQTALYTTIDGHDHSTGKGVQVTPAGLNINADLTFQNNNATNLRTVRLQNLSAAPALGTDINCFCDINGDGYFIDANSNVIRITKSGALNTTFLSFPEQSISGTFTILSSNTNQCFYVNVSSATATVNLPASSAVGSGRAYFFVDNKGNSETNSITLVPNGSDKINGANANYVITSNYSTTLITTDGAGNWDAGQTVPSWARAGGITYTGAFAVNGTTGVNLQYNGTTQLAINTASVACNTTLNFPNSPATLQVAGVTEATISSTLVTLTPPTLQWGAAVSAPTLTQATASGAAQNLTITAQSAGGAANNGGSLNLNSGAHAGAPAFDGYVFLQTNGTSVAFTAPVMTNFMSGAAFGIGNTPGTDPTITRGTGAPSSTQPNGSLFLRTDGTSSTGLYVRESGAWTPFSSGLVGPVTSTTKAVTSGSYTIDSSENDYYISVNFAGAVTLTLPAPTLGRILVIQDISGAAETNNITLARHGSENINGIAASRVLQTNWGTWTVYSPDGTNWTTG